MICAELYVVAESPTAVRICSRCTSPEIRACRAETAKEKAIPLTTEIVRMCHGAITPAADIANRAKKLAKSVKSDAKVIIFRSTRSASAPPSSDNSSIGIIIAAVTIVTMSGEWVRSYIIQPRINICMLNPVKVAKPAAQ